MRTLESVINDDRLMSSNDIAGNSKPFRAKDKTSGVYFLLDEDEIVYVGRSSNCYDRIASHTKNKVFDSFYIYKASQEECLWLEPMYIMKFQPIYNKVIPRSPLFISINSLKKVAGGMHKQKLRRYIGEKGYKPVMLHHLEYYDSSVCELFESEETLDQP